MTTTPRAERPRKSRAPRLNRRLHRIGALVTAAPVLIVILSGLLLQLKKHWSFVQPPTARSAAPALDVDWDTILGAARSIPEAGVETWDDVDRVDVRPGRGIAKVRAKSSWEVQVDTATGEVLRSSYRRSDLIESIHDGSYFGGDAAKLWVFLPAAVILLALWISGVYLWLLPHLVKRRRKSHG
jgi:uncharacterized iron-regulated membrane protein